MRKRSEFMMEFDRVKRSIDRGTTPVFSELRNARTTLLELFPYLIIHGALLVLSTLLIQKIKAGALFSVVILLIVNTTAQTLSSVLLVLLKHLLRVRKLKKHGLQVNEENIAVLECMEYQSV